MSSEQPEKLSRSAYPHLMSITTRWMDNDVYGHVNNVVYYSYFDTVVNKYLIENAGLDIHGGDVIGLVVETTCKYFAPLAFPNEVWAGMKVGRIGNSSVRYEIGLFENTDETPAAEGHFVHVYVDKENRRPVSLPQSFRAALEPLTGNAPRY